MSYEANFLNFVRSTDNVRNDIEIQSNNEPPLSAQLDISRDTSEYYETDPPTQTTLSPTGDSNNTKNASRTGLPQTRVVLMPIATEDGIRIVSHGIINNVGSVSLPAINDTEAKNAISEIARIANYVKNNNSNEDDWEEKINQVSWTEQQRELFKGVAMVLDSDRLARLAIEGQTSELLQLRAVVDKSTARVRRLFDIVHWDTQLTQWLHRLMLEVLPPYAMISYLDIMQSLYAKLPALVERILFGRPLDSAPELVAPIIKQRWEPTPVKSNRELNHKAIILAIPNNFIESRISNRMKRWYHYFTSIGNVIPMTLTNSSGRLSRMSLEELLDLAVAATRVKLQEMRSEYPDKKLILIGFNVGACLALQVATLESVSCVVCVGFSYNTKNGPRGAPDDCILDIETPILFVIGQNSATASRDEMESLREKMVSKTSLLIVGGGDESLRIPKSKRRRDKCTQAMADLLVAEEIFEFVSKTLDHPPGPRLLKASGSLSCYVKNPCLKLDTTLARASAERKRKHDTSPSRSGASTPKTKHFTDNAGRPRTSSAQKPVLKAISNSGIDTSITVPTTAAAAKDHSSSSSSNSINSQCQILANGTIIKKFTPPGTLAATAAMTTLGQRIKFFPQNQIQIKTIPNKRIVPLLANQQYTTATAGKNANISQQQIFTLKAPNGQTSQFVTAAPPTAQERYTIVKEPNGTTSVQYKKKVDKKESNSVVDFAKIIDMPIVIADNDGNITDAPTVNYRGQSLSLPSTSTPKASNTGIQNAGGISRFITAKTKFAPNIIKIPGSTNITPNAKALIQRQINMPAILQKGANINNRFVVLNSSNINNNKTTALAYNAVNATTTTAPMQKIIINSKATSAVGRITRFTPQQLKTLNLQTLKPITSSVGGASGIGGSGTTCPVINIDSSRIQIINKASARKITPIVGNLKPMLASQLSNQLNKRNVTVRKVFANSTMQSELIGSTNVAAANAAVTSTATPIANVVAVAGHGVVRKPLKSEAADNKTQTNVDISPKIPDVGGGVTKAS